MDVVVTEQNVQQVVQAMHENVKSNQHRIDEIEPVLTRMATRVENLATLLVDNGYARAVEENAKDLKAFRGEFQGFLLNREESCPVSKHNHVVSSIKQSSRNWAATVTRLIFGGIGTISTLIIIYEKISM